jgi:hypothetical protein
MNWLERWFTKQVQKAWNSAREEKDYHPATKMEILQLSNHVSKHTGRSLDVQPTLNFRLHHAENGWIVEVTCHDTRTDRHTTRMHLISEDQEFDQAICQIITLEALRG